MGKPVTPESPKERRLNFGVLVFVRVLALALGVLAIAGMAIQALAIERAFGMLLVAFVLLCLADLQDTFAINRMVKVQEIERSKQKDVGGGQKDASNEQPTQNELSSEQPTQNDVSGEQNDSSDA